MSGIRLALLAFALTSTSMAQYLRGVQMAGAEFGDRHIPGVFNRDYTFNSETSFRYFAARSLPLLRLGVRWERLQPVPRGPLDAAYLSGVKLNLAWAAAHGARVVLDVHNYGRYKLNEAGAVNEYVLDNLYGGSAKITGGDLADLWVRLSNELRGNPAIYAYGLMNEPHDMGIANWKTISQAVLMAIRAGGDNQLIMVPGDNWSGAELWARVHGPNGWIADPANNFAYEAHQYFDRDNSGGYTRTYDQELALNPNLATIGPARLAGFVDWLRANGARGYLGEYGVPDTDPRWLAVLDNFLTALDAAGLDGTCWAAGEWWGSYQLSVQPTANFTMDRPQLRVLEAHLAPGSFTTVTAAANHGFAVAPDSLAAGYGAGLAPGVESAALLPLPASLMGTRVELTDAATPAPLVFVSPSQINYLVPAGLAPGRVNVVVKNGETTVGRGILEIDPVAPVLFAANGDGRGIAAAQILRVKADGSQTYEPVAQADAAQHRLVPLPIDFGAPGDRLFLILYGTGFRAGAPASASLRVGVAPLSVAYAGKQATFPGLDQVNAELPRTLAGAGEVSIAFEIGGKTANAVTVAFR